MEFLEAGKARLTGDTKREATSSEVTGLRQENEQLKQVVAELLLKNRVLKKSATGGRRAHGTTNSDLRQREVRDHPPGGRIRATGETDPAEIGLSRSTFYRWYAQYQRDGLDGLADHSSQPRQFWNRISEAVRDQVVQIALQQPELSPRELAWHITDTEGYFISESSVYRILKAFDLITSPAFVLVKAADKFQQPTKRVNELWQTDFSQFKVVGWGYYYLSTVLDDFSRYIIAWKLTTGMSHTDVQDTLDLALAATEVTQVAVQHRPRLLSDNGSAYISADLAEYLAPYHIQHIHGAPYHPQTQGKIER